MRGRHVPSNQMLSPYVHGGGGVPDLRSGATTRCAGSPSRGPLQGEAGKVYVYVKALNTNAVDGDNGWCYVLRPQGKTTKPAAADEKDKEKEEPKRRVGEEKVGGGEGYTERIWIENLPGRTGRCFPVTAFECVDAEAVRECKRVFSREDACKEMKACREVIGRMCDTKGVVRNGRSQVGSDLPPHSFLKDMKTFDGRPFDEGTRGVGGTKHVPLTSVGEEDVLMWDEDRYSESIVAYEIVHSVMETNNFESKKEELRRTKVMQKSRETITM
uniref:Uncharacterized protein n=1 Tax=Chromera velia CCMP2878 TaxID=1169474 RepID=A0A0G4HZ45_9ALVE|eukprot:Cvel_1554.t1-p1 / transcript=Cvel_1554.t1 / gene=Cvel_1554 / organism=Chromera_velia_CCMP2878 / gene_product=hypothetical protein / transcript_product=hypothetical protein / location=Cvel_scaffold55:53219-56545(+) / protein_length=271 / sequence_SO=supercontig / SO=protein_coding / is_pseudo=false